MGCDGLVDGLVVVHASSLLTSTLTYNGLTSYLEQDRFDPLSFLTDNDQKPAKLRVNSKEDERC